MVLEGEDEEKFKRAIVASSILGSIYIFDHLAADEWFVKTKEDEKAAQMILGRFEWFVKKIFE